MAETGADGQPIAVDTFEDDDSAIAVSIGSSLDSLRSSILQNQKENGRTYHAMSAGKYAFPNDSAENERLEVQHYVWNLTLHGALALCPKGTEGASRVLDIGTGTGCWAIDYADAFPEAEVIGVDLSPIQPTVVPPNCRFEIDDVEKDWTWSKPFDFIYSRVMAGSFSNYEDYIKKAYNALEPGGWLEMSDPVFPYKSDDGTLPADSELGKLAGLFIEAAGNLGRPLNIAPTYKDIMEKVGFQSVTEKRFKWPIGPWPREKHFKDIGAGTLANLDGGLEGLVMALFTRGLKWSPEETMVYCSAVRKQFRDRNIHAYLQVAVVYGQKPLEEEKEEPTPADTATAS